MENKRFRITNDFIVRDIWRSASTSCKNEGSKLVDHVPIFWTHWCGLYLKVKLVTDQHAGNEAISHTSPCPSLLSTAASALAQRICSGKPVGTAKLQPFHPNSPRNGGNWHWSVAPWRHLCFFACQNTAKKFQRRMIESRLIPNMSFLGDVTCPIIFRSAKQVFVSSHANFTNRNSLYSTIDGGITWGHIIFGLSDFLYIYF